jgi:hypothetical protein
MDATMMKIAASMVRFGEKASSWFTRVSNKSKAAPKGADDSRGGSEMANKTLVQSTSTGPPSSTDDIPKTKNEDGDATNAHVAVADPVAEAKDAKLGEEVDAFVAAVSNDRSVPEPEESARAVDGDESEGEDEA